MATSQKRSLQTDDAVQSDSGRSVIPTSIDLLLLTPWNATQTTDNVVSECNNNFQNLLTSESTSAADDHGLKVLPGAAAVELMDAKKSEFQPPPGIFVDDDPAKYSAMASSPLRRTIGGFADDFILPPPLEFNLRTVRGDDATGFSNPLKSDNLILPPPAFFRDSFECLHSIQGGENEYRRLKTFCGESTTRQRHQSPSGGTQSGTCGVADVRDFETGRKLEAKKGRNIVGGLFSVREVCALFENDQTHILQDALDEERLEDKQDAIVRPSDLPALCNNSFGKCEAMDIGDIADGSGVADAVVMEIILKEQSVAGDRGFAVATSVAGVSQVANDRKDAPSGARNAGKNDPDQATLRQDGLGEFERAQPMGNEFDKSIVLDLNKVRKNSSISDPTANQSTSAATVECKHAVAATQAPAGAGRESVIIPDKLSPDPDKNWLDPDARQSDPASSSVSVDYCLINKTGVEPETALTTATLVTGEKQRADLKIAEEEREEEDRRTAAKAAETNGAVQAAAADGNLKPEVKAAGADLGLDRARAVLNTNISAESELAIETSPVEGGEKSRETPSRDTPTFSTFGIVAKLLNGSGEAPKRKVTSHEKRKVEVVRVDVSESLEQTENERHFVSKTVKKTMTQETRSSTVGMATSFNAKPNVTSTFSAGIDTTEESVDSIRQKDLEKDAKAVSGLNGSDVSNGMGRSLEVGGGGDGATPRGKPGVVNVGVKGNSVFDTLLDQKETKSEKSSSLFGRKEPSRLYMEKKSSDETTTTRTIEIKTGEPEDVSSNSGAAIGPFGDSSTLPIAQFTERKEEIIRLGRPVSLMVPQTKLTRHQTSSAATTPSMSTETSPSNSPPTGAPLATPEESADDIPMYASRSRHSSVGPCRSRQSSVGPSRSRNSSVSSLLGFQMPSSGVSTHFVVVAIDFGTTYSGYAFSFTRDPDSIHMMRRWEGGDPGIVNQKTPTTLLLMPDGKFHSFGFTARDFYHDLDPQEAKKWLYFEKFKMALHHNADLNKETMIKASNGKSYRALVVFSHALTFFKDHALQELSDQSSTTILNEDIRWVITVPAIWKAPAKQFMRQAAYQAGIASSDNPNQLLIALEPEAASIYVRKLRLYQLMPDPLSGQLPKREPTPDPLNRENNSDEEFASPNSVKYKTLPSSPSYRHSVFPTSTTASVGQEVDVEGTSYMVVDCGGGTVDITVYEMESGCGRLKELHRATGGPYGSLGIDLEFEKLLINIFGGEFIEAFRTKRPAGWVDLMIAFESRKRTASPLKSNPLNVSLPFSFIDYYKKFKGSQVESAIRKHGDKDITWSSQGMLRLTPAAMRRLFLPTLEHIKQAIGDVLNNPNTRDIKYMFLVGGFSESAILQMEMRKEFDHLLRIMIPQDVGLTILKGAVCFGLDPTVVSVRRCRLTYGVGVLNRFVPDKHPRSKMITKDGAQWCTDVFDKFVEVDQSVAVGETVVRSYTPAKAGQKSTIIHVYCTEKLNPQYITDAGVKRCGTLCLDLTDLQYRHSQKPRRREIQARMTFGDTEIKVTALDVATGKYVRAAIDFMSK